MLTFCVALTTSGLLVVVPSPELTMVTWLRYLGKEQGVLANQAMILTGGESKTPKASPCQRLGVEQWFGDREGVELCFEQHGGMLMASVCAGSISMINIKHSDTCITRGWRGSETTT